MTLASEIGPSVRSDDADRNIALLAYALLFLAIFFAGAPALIAVAIAYARRRRVDPKVASHHRFQIFIFWIGFVLTVLATLSGVGAVLSILGDLFSTVVRSGWEGWDVVQATDLHVGHAFVTLMITALIMAGLTALWLMGASAYGFVRLASRRSIRQTART